MISIQACGKFIGLSRYGGRGQGIYELSLLLLPCSADEYVDAAANENEGYEEERGVAGFGVGKRYEEENYARQSGGDDDGAEDFD